MTPIQSKPLPADNLDLRKKIFTGDVFLSEKNAVTTRLVSEVRQALSRELGIEDVRKAHRHLSDEDFFTRMGNLRRTFYLESYYNDLLREVLSSHGFDPDRCAFDPLRIRVILPNGHSNPKAAPVYYGHRDTWYSHPQSLIVGWIPVYDLREEETFHFYPDFFDQPVPNDSEIFDYADWIKDGPALKIGWQKSDSGTTGGYPRSLNKEKPTHQVGFSCEAGETLLFAGSHFHQTREQDFDTIRFSLDYRVVHLDDEAQGRGAPNVDNRSRGNILADYIQPKS